MFPKPASILLLQSAPKINEGKNAHLKIMTLLNIKIFYFNFIFRNMNKTNKQNISNPERPIGYNRLA